MVRGIIEFSLLFSLFYYNDEIWFVQKIKFYYFKVIGFIGVILFYLFFLLNKLMINI